MVLLKGGFNHGLRLLCWGVVDFLNVTKRFLPDDSVSVLSALE